MRVVFKCESCKTGPCYCEAMKPERYEDQYDSSIQQPVHCPYDNDNCANWEPLKVKIDGAFCEWLVDWLAGEGYDQLPEEIRDTILSGGLDFRGVFWGQCAMNSMNLMRKLEDWQSTWEDREDAKKNLAKKTKQELMEELLPVGFQAGLVYAYKNGGKK